MRVAASTPIESSAQSTAVAGKLSQMPVSPSGFSTTRSASGKASAALTEMIDAEQDGAGEGVVGLRALAAAEQQRDHDRRSHADEVRHGEVEDHERHGEVHGGKGGRAEVLTHEDAVEGLVEGGCEHADGAGYGGLEEEARGRGLCEELVRGHRAPPSSVPRRSPRRPR